MELYLKEEVEHVINRTLDKCGYAHKHGIITYEFNMRFTARLGDAERNHIRFSFPLWGLCSVEEREDTIIHEVCHVINWWQMLANKKIRKAHGPEWKYLMILAGGNPNARYDPKVVFADNYDKYLKIVGGRKKTQYSYNCQCGKHYTLSANIVGRMRNLTSKYNCRKCKTQISYERIERC